MADLISQIKGLDNVTYDLQDKVSTFGNVNLLRHTQNPSTTDYVLSRSSYLGDGIFRLTPTTSAAYIKWRVNYLDYADYKNNYFTTSFDAKLADVESTYTNMNLLFYLGVNLSTKVGSILSSSYDRYSPSTTITTDLTSEWQRFSVTKYVPTALTSGKAAALADGNFITPELGVGGSRKPVEVKNLQLEIGNKPTEWKPSPYDLVTYSNETIEFFQ